MTANGKGALSDRDPLAQNILGGMELLREADVIFAVGTRFVDPATARWGVVPDQTIIQMDIDPEEIARNTPVTVAIEADAKAGLATLADLVEHDGHQRPPRSAELEELKRGLAERARAVGPQAEYALAIR
jgi:acetolactate synthase-1/2/3 large subunit